MSATDTSVSQDSAEAPPSGSAPEWPSIIRFAVPGLVLLGFAASILYQRAAIDIAGQVISREKTCERPPDYHCQTTYKIHEGGNRGITVYTSNGSDPALSLDIPLGALLVKRFGHLSYTVDGVEEIATAFAAIYGTMALIGLALFGWGIFLLWRRWQFLAPPIAISSKLEE